MQVVPKEHCWQVRHERNLTTPQTHRRTCAEYFSPTPAIGVAAGILWDGVEMLVGC